MNQIKICNERGNSIEVSNVPECPEAYTLDIKVEQYNQNASFHFDDKQALDDFMALLAESVERYNACDDAGHQE